jgi:ABC-type phosphate/phosphonate transport system substrate-binding protein
MLTTLLKSALTRVLADVEKEADRAEVLRQLGTRGFIETKDKDYRYLYKSSDEVGISL